MTTTNKYAVIVSDEKGNRPNIEAMDISLEEAEAIASAGGRVDCLPIGRASRSFVRADGWEMVWSVVPSAKNRRP